MKKPTYVYNGKIMGRGSTADVTDAELLMQQFNNNAQAILDANYLLSSETKSMLTNVAKLQAKENKNRGTEKLRVGCDSPWGEIDNCDEIADGIYSVSTSSHGGIMVAKTAKDFLSSKAKELSLRFNGYLCYEEDCDINVVVMEMLDHKMLQEGTLFKLSNKDLEGHAIESLQQWYPDYWKYRERKMKNKQDIDKETDLDI